MRFIFLLHLVYHASYLQKFSILGFGSKQALYSLTPSYAWERPCCPTVLIRFLQLWCILSSFVSIKVQFTGEILDETVHASKYTGIQCIKSKVHHLKIFRRIRRQYTNWTKATSEFSSDLNESSSREASPWWCLQNRCHRTVQSQLR